MNIESYTVNIRGGPPRKRTYKLVAGGVLLTFLLGSCVLFRSILAVPDWIAEDPVYCPENKHNNNEVCPNGQIFLLAAGEPGCGGVA